MQRSGMSVEGGDPSPPSTCNKTSLLLVLLPPPMLSSNSLQYVGVLRQVIELTIGQFSGRRYGLR